MRITMAMIIHAKRQRISPFIIIYNNYRIIDYKTNISSSQIQHYSQILRFLDIYPRMVLTGFNKSCYQSIKHNMKGSLYANPTFIRKPIKEPTVISIRPLVAYDDSRLYFNNTSMRWQAKDIVNCTYSKLYKVLLVLTDDFRIYVFTSALELITILHNWQPKYIVGFELLEQLGMLLLIGTEQIEVMRVHVSTNVLRTKFLSSMKFSMKREAHLSVEPQHKLKWNKGYGYVIEEDLLYLWSLQDVHFFSLQKLTLRTKITNIAKKQISITTIFFSNYYKYTVMGLLNGQIRVWRLPTNSLYNQKEMLIHSYGCHSREVQQIIQGPTPKVVISYALDLYVHFLSLQTFQVLRSFNFAGEYSKIYLYGHLIAYAIKDSYLGELNFGENLEFIADLTGPPVFHSNAPALQGDPKKVQLTLSSNLGIQVDLQELASARDLNKMQLAHIYPPLKSKNIVQILSSPFAQSAYFLLVQDGDIFRAILQNNMGRIQHHHVVAKSCDSEKHQLHQNGSLIAFLNIIPPEIDTEIIEKTTDKTYKDSHRQTLRQKLKLIAVGCSRGSIVFLLSQDLQTIYARVSYHRQRITDLQEAFCQGRQWLLSVCQQRFLKVVDFSKSRAHCLYTLFCGEKLSSIRSFENQLMLIFDHGLFQLAKFIPDQQPTVILNRESVNHEDEIVAVSFRSDLRLILTGGLDNRIKIWTTYKILLYQIILDEGLRYCLWGGGMNLLLVQKNRLFCLRELSLQLKKHQIEQLNKAFQHSYLIQDEIALSKYLEEILAKGKQRAFKVRPPRKHLSLHDSPLRQENKRMQTSPNRRETHDLNRSLVLGVKTPLRPKASTKTQQSEQKARQQFDAEAVRRHLEQLASLKKMTNQSVLPKLKPKYQDIFVDFMREKLLNKRLLTRRDITLNRIIMKNLIKDHLGRDNDMLKNFKLQ